MIGPEDSDYDQARIVSLGGIDRHPAAIVRVADADDAAQVIATARETGLELAVRSGGHSGAGHSVTEGGIVLDLRDMKDADFDLDAGTVWAQTGLTAGEMTSLADEKGVAVGFGDTGSVGIGGITTGGGIGYLTRKFGMTIDSVLAAEVVTADGQVLHVDSEAHPDLFWAVRGGGGNFGVVTRFKYRLHPLPGFVGGMLLLPGHGRDGRRLHRGRRGSAGRAVDHRQRDAHPTHAVRAGGVARQAGDHGPARLRRRCRGRATGNRALPRAGRADRRHGAADVLRGDVPARGRLVPPAGGGARRSSSTAWT